MPRSPKHHSLLTSAPGLVEWVWRLCFAPLSALARLVWTYRAVGRELLPAGPAIVVANHVSYLDTPLVGYAVGRPCAFLAKAEVFAWPVVGTLARWAGALPVVYGESGATFQQAVAVLDAGYPVVLFPEGGRNPDLTWGSLPLHRGAARLALARPVPIVPIGLSGTELAWPPGQRWPRRATAEAVVGAPLQPADYLPAAGLPESERIAAITALISDAVRHLLPAHLRTGDGPRVTAAGESSAGAPRDRTR